MITHFKKCIHKSKYLKLSSITIFDFVGLIIPIKALLCKFRVFKFGKAFFLSLIACSKARED
ncbi:hypothetical protein DPV48_09565 [Campylobacter coli]|nr:hypothetical protein [Campylobacter coli]EAH5109539.1 hypothetical protein [Campylobacter coli]EAL3549238.1 hypothetical protein [Campylobacter coli]EAL5221406.1 hypothetical protein [Campylobacter coli]EAL8325289.1 hypothetical protein [Campylobacter coli]